MKKAYIETYGCQMNVNDTEVIFAILREAGYERTEKMEEAGLIMANTCSIRDNAEQRIWGRLEVFGQQKKARPQVLVGIVGCMAERLKDNLLDTGKVDLVVGPDAYRSLPRLLERVAAIAPDLRVRFATSHPKDISDEVIETMAAQPNICRHIHLPVQSGSSRMLEKMRRKYDREWYLERVAKIRSLLPDCGLTTDVIAGFCSETEEDHRETLSLMEQVGFDWAFMFAYSDRPGTLANRTMQDDVPADVKNRRLNEIIRLQNRKSLERYRAQIGKEVEVLVEGPSKRDPGQLCGRASNNMMCVFPALDRREGSYVRVRVKDCTSATLICE